jgi:tRNA (guanine26-N2/guanine27-N2)-dimethyltransferase
LSPVAPAREGATELALPPSPAERGPAKRRAVFYNAAMALDRDLSVAVLAAWRLRAGDALRGWDMLSATGARGLRLLHESGAFAEMTLTDAHPEAQAVLAANAGPFAPRGARVLPWDARRPIAHEAFEYVDLDPFGTPVPFLTAAFESLIPGGLLAVTATDMPVLAGVQRKACEGRYGATPLRGHLGPEGGLRILLAYLDRAARARGRTLRPMLAYVLGHHVRAYVEVSVPRPAEDAPAPVGPLPFAGYAGPPLPPGGPYGPLWLGALFDPAFVSELRVPSTPARERELTALLGRFHEESRVDHPFFYEPNRIARSAGLAAPPSLERLAARLRSDGFAFGRSHARPSAFRTDAPASRVLDAARAAAQ